MTKGLSATRGDAFFDLQDRVAVVTGGARGIGAAICRALICHGARVVCCDLSSATLDALQSASTSWPGTESSQLHTRVVDVASDDSVTSCVSWVDERFSRLDILVNNAGIPAEPAPLWQTSTEHWRRIYDVHVDGTFYMLRAAIPLMLRRSYGRIVNISSMAGKEGNPNASAYSSAKAAVIGLTKSVGKELAASGVLANAVTPGFIDTPLVATFSADRQRELLSRVPMGRPGRVEEVADLVLFLASSRLGFSTGSVYDISGGRATY
jgi:3-oxoacyl-[acyl-carrier protein] reductase